MLTSKRSVQLGLVQFCSNTGKMKKTFKDFFHSIDGEEPKLRAILSSQDIKIPSHFNTNDAESNNNRLKAKKSRKRTGFCGTADAVQSLALEEDKEFAQTVGDVSESYELRPEFTKFVVDDFFEWTTSERAEYVKKLQESSIEELHIAESNAAYIPATVGSMAELKQAKIDQHGTTPQPLYNDSDIELSLDEESDS